MFRRGFTHQNADFDRSVNQKYTFTVETFFELTVLKYMNFNIFKYTYERRYICA